MSAPILVLGPQRPVPNLAQALEEHGITGPVAVITAGWRYDEGETEALWAHLPQERVHLPLYRWFDEIMDGAPELKAAWRSRQDRIHAFKDLYRVRLSSAYGAVMRLAARPVEDPGLHDAELIDAVGALRALDDRVIEVCDRIRAESGLAAHPWEHPAFAEANARIRSVLDGCQALCIAGGHVAVLLNRMQAFGMEELLPAFQARGGLITAWSGGAQVLCERVVVYYDDPPEGPSEPEVLDTGLGLISGMTLFPHARRRLRLDEDPRLRLLTTRFGLSLGLECEARMEVHEGRWDDLGPEGTLLRLAPGSVPPAPLATEEPEHPEECKDASIGPFPLVPLVRRLVAEPEHRTQVIEDFVSCNTFPLVDGSKATFFFWDGQQAEAIYLLHWVNGLESRREYHRIEHTDAWFCTVDLPLAGRVEYKLELHRGGKRRLVRDPHNPRLARDPFGANSVCPMPGYTEPVWAFPEPGVRGGTLTRFSLASAVWGEVRETVVYLPNEYKAHKRYPLLICHDGKDYLNYAGAVQVLDNLIHRQEVSPMVVAFTSGGPGRNEEYGANPKQAAYIVDELLPALTERFGVSKDPEDRGLMGASFGGVTSLYTAWSRPGVFGRLLLQSGSLVFTDVGHHGRSEVWDPVVDFVNAFRKDPAAIQAQVFMSCGTFEGLIFYNRALPPLMRAAGLKVRFVESQDGHNWVAWRDRLRDGLTWLYPGHLWLTYP